MVIQALAVIELFQNRPVKRVSPASGRLLIDETNPVPITRPEVGNEGSISQPMDSARNRRLKTNSPKRRSWRRDQVDRTQSLAASHPFAALYCNELQFKNHFWQDFREVLR